MPITSHASACALVCAVLGVTGCASYPKTTKLAAYNLGAGYRFEQLPPGLRVTKTTGKNSDKLFVVLAFSGGGTRAAALSYGVLRQLKNITFHVDDATGEPVECPRADSPECKANERTLLDEVDVISSVSGGSFTSAYYALNGDEMFDEASAFHTQFLYYPLQRDLFSRAVYHPQNWVRLRSRAEIAANLYAERVFGNQTFAALKQRPRPYVILNATDMATGARFEFTQEQFDLLCADLDPVPLARGVAASSAFPGLLNSMTIDSFNLDTKGCGYDGPGSHDAARRAGLPPREKDWVDLALANEGRSNPDAAYSARLLEAYRDPSRLHLHLLDGGLADNIGARALIDGIGTLQRPVKRLPNNEELLGGWSVLSKLNQGETKTVLVIVVNARTSRTQDWDRNAAGPGTASVLGVSSGVPMGNYSHETLSRMRELLRAAVPTFSEPDGPKLYGLEVNFDGLPTAAERTFFANLGTNFELDRYEVDCLIDRGGSLLRNGTFIQPLAIGDKRPSEAPAMPFSLFVQQRLKQGTIVTPPGSSLACTADEGKKHIEVRSHYLDVGVQMGVAIPGSSDVDAATVNVGATFRAARPDGWGVVVDVGPQSFSIVGDAVGTSTNLGDLRLWSFMGGIARTRVIRRAEATVGVAGGIGLGSFSPSLGARDIYGRLGIFGLEGHATNTWLVKPQASLWYNLSDRLAATVSASYVFGRPTVRLSSPDAVPFDRQVSASMFSVGAGIGFKIF
jgi:NTE family protein